MDRVSYRTELALVLSVLVVLFGCGDKKTVSLPKAASEESTREEHAEGETTTVVLTPDAAKTAGIETAEAKSVDISFGGEVADVPGQVDFDPRRVAVISPRIAGRIERVLVSEGDRVRAGQTVALVQSAAFLTAQTDYLQAVRRANSLRGTVDAQGADAIADAAKRRLKLMGLDDSAIAELAKSGIAQLSLPVTAPFAGSIIEENAMAGAAIEAGAPIYKLADLSVVDVIADVPERLIPFVKVGLPAKITIGAYPDISFNGEMERLRDVLNAETRTIRAVIHVAHPSFHLRPGMFASVQLRTSASGAARASGVTISETALVSDGTTRYAFVETRPLTFERRTVVLHTSPIASAHITKGDSAKSVIVLSGVRSGEKVVTRGAFVLKSELAKAAFAEDE